MIYVPIKNQKGYMDLQTPPIIIGLVLTVGLTHFLASTEMVPILSYLGVVIIFAVFALGFYMNIDSLKCPESPFNKHTSPFFIAFLVIGSLAYGIWKLYKGPHAVFLYIFGIGICLTVIYAVYALSLRSKNN